MPGSGCGPFFVCGKQQLKKKGTWVKHDPVHLRRLEESQPFLQHKQKPASFHVFPGGGAAVPTTRCSPVTQSYTADTSGPPLFQLPKKNLAYYGLQTGLALLLLMRACRSLPSCWVLT